MLIKVTNTFLHKVGYSSILNAIFFRSDQEKNNGYKMKCFYKRGRSECTKPVISICSNCKTQEYYCKRHGRHHSLHTKHNILSILSLGLNYFKKEIKACIRNIATNTDAVISEIRRTSLNAIVQLKIVNKNVENIEELTLKPYNTNRITFLIEPASYN